MRLQHEASSEQAASGGRTIHDFSYVSLDDLCQPQVFCSRHTSLLLR